MITSNASKFAELFNNKFANACRKIAANDIRLMTECKLIGRYGFYLRQDLETVRGILQYEQFREYRSSDKDKEKEPPTCKRCGQPLLQTQKVRLDDLKNIAPIANLREVVNARGTSDNVSNVGNFIN